MTYGSRLFEIVWANGITFHLWYIFSTCERCVNSKLFPADWSITARFYATLHVVSYLLAQTRCM